MLLLKVMEMDVIKKHLDSKENHHQWYQVKYEVKGEILDFDEDGLVPIVTNMIWSSI